MIFDTHAHYDDAAFDDDRDELLNSLPAQGVREVINCCADYASLTAVPAIARRYENVYFAAGLHPENLEGLPADAFERVRGLLSDEKCVAVGEIGLDYHWDASAREVQKEWFRRQLDLANSLDMPVIVHDRDAHADTLEILMQKNPRGVLHCFSGSAETAAVLLGSGMYLGFGGSVTFKGNRKAEAVVLATPDDRILLETDCPYMTPVPHRGERNSSPMIVYVAQRLAQIRGTTPEKIIDLAADNARKLFFGALPGNVG